MTIKDDRAQDYRVVTKQKFLGDERRWRRFGAPIPAGSAVSEGQPLDFGLFGPDSVVWEVLLHPATIVFQYAAQAALQGTYRPISAGVRDADPISRAARKGILTSFDVFERGQRNSGMHAPMWLGDTETAERMAKHLHNIHRKVAGDVIDVGDPQLGGYAASEPRDAMWAALTEMHSMLWVYEAFAFRDGRPPHRLSDSKRDQYIAESAAYCRLVGAREDEIPHTMSELRQLYDKYDAFFGVTPSTYTLPETHDDFEELVMQNLKRNFHWTQLLPATLSLVLDAGLYRQWFAGAASSRYRRSVGMGPIRSRLAKPLLTLSLPLIWLLQRRFVERAYMRLMWGPDGVQLIAAARRLRRLSARYR